MRADTFDLSKYYKRIGFEGQATADLEGVAAVMRHQLRAVPFENLDVQAGKPVSILPEDIVDKLVHRRRGGYCYEVNGLFAMALTALGVDYRFVGCRPMTTPDRRPRTHMAILVRFGGAEWLCDLGFGAYGMRAPLRLDHADAVVQDHDAYRLEAVSADEYVFRAKVDGAWADQYSFDLSPHEWVDFAPANWFNSTAAESLFVRHLLVMRHTPEGRVVLFDGRLKTIARGETSVRHIDADERAAVLRDLFGLEMPATAPPAASADA